MMLFIFYVLLFTFPLPLSLVSYSHLEAWLGAPALALYTSATVALSDRLEVKGCKIVRKLHVNEVLHLVGASLAQRAIIIRIRIRMRMITATEVAEGKASAIAVCVDVIERAVYEEGRAKSSSIEALAAARPRQAGHAAVPESLPHRGSAPAHLRRSLRS